MQVSSSYASAFLFSLVNKTNLICYCTVRKNTRKSCQLYVILTIAVHHVKIMGKNVFTTVKKYRIKYVE